MDKEEDFTKDIDDILKREEDISDKYESISSKKGGDNLEDHYTQMYKDLPPDVVKMLIDTHPLHRDSGTEYTLPAEEKIKQEVIKKETPKKETEIPKVPVETKKVKPKKSKSTEFEYDESEYIDEFEEEEGDEKEFIYSLFSKTDDEEHVDLKKYMAIAILTTILFVCIIGTAVNIIQNKKYKQQVAALEAQVKKLDIENGNAKILYDGLEKAKENLQKEVESLKSQLTSNPDQEIPEQNNEPTVGTQEQTTTTNQTSAPKSHKIAKGDNLWKISQKYYGSASQEYVNAIMNANGIKNASEIKVGTTLKIPEVGGK